ncbi:MAG: Uncharacterized protein HW399_185 [Dehalococcoidia bacterium]|nr:Uncharacterized protein [Dehalococcoidia bacterium]
MPTRYIPSAQTGDTGIAYVRYVASQIGLIYRPFENVDLGVDGALEFIEESREPSGDLVLVQAKSGSSFIRDNAYYLLADRDHFETWARYSIPIIGIVHNPARADARWVNISDHLKEHPEQIANGPYRMRAPQNQAFTVEGGADLIRKFRRNLRPITSVATPPNLSIRPWQAADAIPTRALLAPLSSDYPNFYQWLETQWQDTRASKKVVQVGGSIAAYSMWKKKDSRNIKLQTFVVGPLFRGSAVGQHLLYHELRNWSQDPEIERVYVTVSSHKADLLEYFYRFGFRVEGIAANRYARHPIDAELVLVKHFVRGFITSPEQLEGLNQNLCHHIWGINDLTPCSNVFGVKSDDFSAPLKVPQTTVTLNSSERSVASRITLSDQGGTLLRRYDDYMLMREFYPLRLYLSYKNYIVVPIHADFSDELFAREPAPTNPTKLKLRVDHVYYCTPRHTDLISGDWVLFYETKSGGGAGEAFGTAIVRECKTDTPEALWQQYKNRGVFRLEDIRQHSKDGISMAIHFDFFGPFAHCVSLDRIRTLLNRNTIFQSLTSISRDEFLNIISEGDLMIP